MAKQTRCSACKTPVEPTAACCPRCGAVFMQFDRVDFEHMAFVVVEEGEDEDTRPAGTERV